MKIAIICPSGAEFRAFVQSINTTDAGKFHHVQSVDDCEGMEFSNVLHVGAWHTIPRCVDVRSAAHTRVYSAPTIRAAFDIQTESIALYDAQLEKMRKSRDEWKAAMVVLMGGVLVLLLSSLVAVL